VVVCSFRLSVVPISIHLFVLSPACSYPFLSVVFLLWAHFDILVSCMPCSSGMLWLAIFIQFCVLFGCPSLVVCCAVWLRPKRLYVAVPPAMLTTLCFQLPSLCPRASFALLVCGRVLCGCASRHLFVDNSVLPAPFSLSASLLLYSFAVVLFFEGLVRLYGEMVLSKRELCPIVLSIRFPSLSVHASLFVRLRGAFL